MDNYKPNSHRSKEALAERPKMEKVVTGDVKVKKKSDIHKFADVFISEDIHNVKNYVLMDVLVPAIKKAVSDIVRNGIDMILYGKDGSSTGRTSSIDSVSYRPYDRAYERGGSSQHPTVRATRDYNNITLTTRAEAEAVLDRLCEALDIYQTVSVGDLYDLVGIQGSNTDNKYGWSDLHTAKVIPTRDGYLLKLPRAMPID